VELKIESNFWSSLFNAKSIAVVGANNTPGTWGHKTMLTALNAVKKDSSKHAYAINAKTPEVQGTKAYTSLLEIPGPVDLVVVVVRAEVVPGIMRQCVQKGVKAVVLISAGFAEMGAEGAKLQNEVVEIAREGGIHFVGPNCAGHFDLHTRMGSTADVADGLTGSVALLSQSGTFGGAIIQVGKGKGLGFSKFVSTGNETNLHFEDYMEYLAQDPDTRIIAGYVEGLREGRRFYELARNITLKKPIIVIKTGTTESSSKAAKSHTGALAGGDAAYSAAFKQAGVIRVEDDEELCDVALTYLNMPLPKGRKVCVVTVGGGFGVMAAEACEKAGLQIPTLETKTIEKINAILPPQWSHGNPVDIVNLLSMDNDPIIPSCLRYIMEDKNVDAIVSLLPPVTANALTTVSLSPDQLVKMQTKYREYMLFLHNLAKEYDKPLILQQCYFNIPAPGITDGLASLDFRVPEFNDIRRFARTLKLLVDYQEYLAAHKK